MVEANPSHFDYGQSIVLLICGIGGKRNTLLYKEHLKRTGILNRKVELIENQEETFKSVKQAISDVQFKILIQIDTVSTGLSVHDISNQNSNRAKWVILTRIT